MLPPTWRQTLKRFILRRATREHIMSGGSERFPQQTCNRIADAQTSLRYLLIPLEQTILVGH
eukprot:413095-Pyramimonas_sp.AAC.1